MTFYTLALRLIAFLAIAQVLLGMGSACYLLSQEGSAGINQANITFDVLEMGAHGMCAIWLFAVARDSRTINFAISLLLVAVCFSIRPMLLAENLPLLQPLAAFYVLRHVPTEAFLPLVAWLFFSNFPKTYIAKADRIARYGIIVAAVTGVSLMFICLFAVTSPNAELYGFDARSKGSSSAYWIAILCVLCAALLFGVWKARYSQPIERRRILLLIIGLVTLSIPSVLVGAYAAVNEEYYLYVQTTEGAWIIRFAQTNLVLLPFISAYAVQSQGFLSVRRLFNHRARYVVSVLFLYFVIAIPLVYLLIDLLFGQNLAVADSSKDLSLWMKIGLIGGLLGLMFRHRIEKYLEHTLLRTAISRKASLQLISSVPVAASIYEYSEFIISQIRFAIAPDRVSFYISGNDEDHMECLGGLDPPILIRDALEYRMEQQAYSLHPVDSTFTHELFVPLRMTDGRLWAGIALGRKMSGSSYVKRDYRYLEEVALLIGDKVPLYEDGTTSIGKPTAQECGHCKMIQSPEVVVCPDCRESLEDCELPYELNGKYQLIKLAGIGGQGKVYQALDLALNRFVALKYSPAGITSRQENFVVEKEASFAAKFDHPNVTRVYGIEKWGGRRILVSEFLEGGTLENSSVDQFEDDRVLLAFCTQLCSGVAYLHSKGVLHLDLKPSNIGLDSQLVPKILDFGLATSASSGKSSAVQGTREYLSPEALAGKEPDVSFDLWALCEILSRIISTIDSGVQEGSALIKPKDRLAKVLAECMSTTLRDRPATANELAARIMLVF